MKISLLECST